MHYRMGHLIIDPLVVPRFACTTLFIMNRSYQVLHVRASKQHFSFWFCARCFTGYGNGSLGLWVSGSLGPWIPGSLMESIFNGID